MWGAETWRVNSFFLKGMNPLRCLGLDLEAIAVNGKVSIIFWGLWIGLTSPIYSGMCSMNINHRALYADYKSLCSHRDCYSLAALSSEAVFENRSVFCWWLLAVYRDIKMRVCQHWKQQCDIVKCQVVTSKPGWRLGSAYLHQWSLFAPLLGWSKQTVLGRQAGAYLHWAAGWRVGTC